MVFGLWSLVFEKFKNGVQSTKLQALSSKHKVQSTKFKRSTSKTKGPRPKTKFKALSSNQESNGKRNKINKIVLAYSGGLDTSVMLRWLKEQYDCEVICYCADVGQGEELSGLEEKALATGGSKLYVEDLREEFVRDYVWTAVKATQFTKAFICSGLPSPAP